MLEKELLESLSQKQKQSIFKVMQAFNDYARTSEFSKSLCMGQDSFYITVYLDAYKNAFDEMTPDYAEKRAKVAIDWVRFSLFAYAHSSSNDYKNSFLALLYFRLAYDIKNQTARSPGFLTKKLEDMACFFNSLGTEEKIALGFLIYGLIAASIVTVLISALLWLMGVINPITMPLLLTPIVLGMGAFIFHTALSYVRENFDIEKHFISVTPTDGGMHGDHRPRFAHSRSQWAIHDRHMRPYDNLGLFASKNFEVSDCISEIKKHDSLPGLQ